MDIIFFGNGSRSKPCLNSLLSKKNNINAIVAHPKEESKWFSYLAEVANSLQIPIFSPKNPNEKSFEKKIKSFAADLFIFAGYGKILNNNIIKIPKKMCVNLHGGKLPKYRGSSPMNWALINGEKSFTLSIIELKKIIDGGPVLLEKEFIINENSTIVDLHKIANEEFPKMLKIVVDRINDGLLTPIAQDESKASYFPLRFPDDGFILWDMLSAEQIHNRIRALTYPYPCAFSYYKNDKIKLLKSELDTNNFYGEAGRIYRIEDNRLLISAKQGSLWITEAVFESDGSSLAQNVKRYQSLSTIKDICMNYYSRLNDNQ
tara:strand:- start:5252 stop:6205 length:954 start_codon:yes stop_codon:yes gene_type:complete